MPIHIPARGYAVNVPASILLDFNFYWRKSLFLDLDIGIEEPFKSQCQFSVSKSQIRSLWIRFQELDREKKGHLTKQDFERIPELQTNPLCDRIIQTFVNETQQKRLVASKAISRALLGEHKCG